MTESCEGFATGFYMFGAVEKLVWFAVGEFIDCCECCGSLCALALVGECEWEDPLARHRCIHGFLSLTRYTIHFYWLKIHYWL